MRKYVDFIEGTDGKAVAGASVLVLNYLTGATATIYSDADGLVPITNPTKSDSTGRFSFYAPDGRYTLQITGTGLSTQTVSDVVIVDELNVLTKAGEAATSATTATTQAGLATTAKTNAATSETNAASSSTQAGNYAAAAATGAKFYDTIALGLAGVLDTQTFGVKAGGSDGLLRPSIYRRNTGPVAEFLYAVLPASEFDANLDDIAPPDHAWAVVDQDGKATLGIENNGTVNAPALKATTLNGTSVATIIANSAAAAGFKGNSTFIADIVHIPIYGQSLSTGVSTNAVISTVQRFNNLRFSGGVRAQDSGVKYASLVPLVEQEKTPAEGEAVGTYARETPATGMSDYIRELIDSEDGLTYTEHSYQILVSAPGIGGVTIATLSKPSTYYTRLLEDVQAGYNLAQAAGKTFKVPAFCWLQGESDGPTAVATYLAAMEQLRSDFNTDVQAITKQTETVQMVIYQTAPTSNSQLAQLQAVETYPNIHMAGPHYHLAKSDGTHFTGLSSKIYGAYLGRAVKRVCIDGGDWDPVRPLTVYKQGALIYAKFHLPKGINYPLVLDTGAVAAQANSGFSLVDSAGGALAISSVALAGPNTVRITAAAAVPAGAKLRYAIATPLGNLRDSAGSIEIFNGNGINQAMHNWCAAFEKTIT